MVVTVPSALMRRTAWVPASATYTRSWLSTATPQGVLSPTVTDCRPSPAPYDDCPLPTAVQSMLRPHSMAEYAAALSNRAPPALFSLVGLLTPMNTRHDGAVP